MKLYYSPGACSLGIHVLLEETGADYELRAVDLQAGEQYQSAFVAINPKSMVPALVLADGAVLTEWPAIATWIAASHPAARLLPAEALAQARVLEAVTYINSTMHPQGFFRMFRPVMFSENPADADAIKQKGREIFTRGFEMMAEMLGEKDYLASTYSIADAALFYVTFWATVSHTTLPASIEAHYARMLARPAVARAMQAEGLA